MGWYGDPDALDASARTVAADADAVRLRAEALDRSLAAMLWQGAGATAFRRTVETDATALRRAARELDEASAALRAHAAEVRERLAAIRALEGAVSGDLEWLDVGDHLRARGIRL